MQLLKNSVYKDVSGSEEAFSEMRGNRQGTQCEKYHGKSQTKVLQETFPNMGDIMLPHT